MISVDELLQPVSAEQPCGEDFTYHPSLQELDTLVQGKPETQVGEVISQAEDPDWKGVLESSVGILKQSKHLRVAVTLCLAELKVDGFAGFRDGLTVLKGLLETFWNDIYPKLDPDDNNDPTERVNILNNLSAPIGTFGDPYRFLERLRQAPLCSSAQMGRVTLNDILDAEDPNKPAAEAPAEGGSAAKRMSGAQITAAFRDSDPAALNDTLATVGQIIEIVSGINSFLTGTVGAVNGASLGDLTTALKKIQGSLAANMPGGAGLVTAGADGRPAQSGGGGGGGGSVGDGTIRSREDVIFVLGQICDFYARTEPSSPVPLLLKRAQRLVPMNFLEIMSDLTPDALNQLKVIAGADPAEAAQQ